MVGGESSNTMTKMTSVISSITNVNTTSSAFPQSSNKIGNVINPFQKFSIIMTVATETYDISEDEYHISNVWASYILKKRELRETCAIFSWFRNSDIWTEAQIIVDCLLFTREIAWVSLKDCNKADFIRYQCDAECKCDKHCILAVTHLQELEMWWN